MAASLVTQFTWFVTELQALGLTVVKGRPTWGRGTLTPPVVALAYEALEPDASARIGTTASPLRSQWAITLYGRDEPDLLVLLDTVRTWAQSAAAAVIDGTRYPLAFSGGERVPNETGAQQEAYAFALRYSLRI